MPQEGESQFLKDFEPLVLLGAGAFGVVIEAKKKLDQKMVAVKITKLPSNDEDKQKVLREIQLLANLKHINIVQYFYSWIEEKDKGDKFCKDALPIKINIFLGWGKALIQRLNIGDSKAIAQKFLGEISSDDEEGASNDDFSGGSSRNLEHRSESLKSGASDEESEASNEESEASIEESEASNAQVDFTSGSSIAFEHDSKSVEFLDQPKVSGTYLYFAMELCQKETLQMFLEKKKDASGAWPIFKDICLGLDYIHSENLIHR